MIGVLGMSKIIEQITKTTVEYTKKVIEGTNFVKWYATKIEEINGVVETKKYCGVCESEVFDNHNSVTSISNHIAIKEFYRQQGAFAVIHKSELEKVMNCEKYISEVIEQLSVDNIDDPNYEIVIWGYGAHQLMNLNKEFIPVPIHFDYLNGSLSNEYYDLKDAVVKIKNSPYTLKKAEVEIKKIPYYNCTKESNLQIEFYTMLPLELYKKYQGLKINMSSYTAERFVLEDIYGLKHIEAF